MSSTDIKKPRLTVREWRTVMLASIGNGIEYYDFIVFATFAQYISAQIFPSSDGTASLLNTFVVFGIGYLIRPLGGIVLGTFGDRFGRRTIFLFTLLVISLSTIAMGLTPNHATIGLASPVIFVILRLCQGLCYGGESAGAFTYCTEVAPQRAGLACGIIYCFTVSGVVLANTVSGIIHSSLSAADVAVYGWRIAFMIGGALGLLGLVVRRKLEESPEFERMRGQVLRAPLAAVFRNYRWQLPIGVCLVAPLGVSGGLLFAFMPVYLVRYAGYSPTIVPTAIAVGSIVWALSSILYGWASDFVGRAPLYRLGCFCFAVGSWPFYFWLANKSASPLIIITAASFFTALITGSLGPSIASLFPTEVRFTGYGFCYNIGNALFQGLSPLTATYLLAGTGSLTSPSLVWVFAGVVGLSASLASALLTRKPSLIDTKQGSQLDRAATLQVR